MFSKKKLILKRLKQTYCRLGKSKIAGIGVIAIRDIPKGTNPFQGIHEQKWEEIETKDLKKLDKEVLRMINDFLVIEKNNTVMIPEYGMNGMDISFFLNHSRKPNMKTADGNIFLTLRKIKKGEEVTVNYGTYDYKYA
ncbi:SET domain-containing protein [Candidatus Woesearchaeota archaeon]|nr:SET domain-containing protein [Candidatus Woesearchaeota archaeon]